MISFRGLRLCVTRLLLRIETERVQAAILNAGGRHLPPDFLQWGLTLILNL